MTIPPIFYAVVSESDGFTDNPLLWETDPSKATRADAERERQHHPVRYGATWIAVVRILTQTREEAQGDE